VRPPVDKLLEDIILAADVAREIVDRGREQFESDLVARFGAEEVVGLWPRVEHAVSGHPQAACGGHSVPPGRGGGRLI
jgi:hypothetical protein